LEEELYKLRDENDKYKAINHDLKNLVETKTSDREYGDGYEDTLDNTYMDLKHKHIIESLDSRCESLRKRNQMLKSENEMLRDELKVLCSSGTNLHEKYHNGKLLLPNKLL
jgi:cell division protein FtsB